LITELAKGIETALKN